jgi:hypothetical protein
MKKLFQHCCDYCCTRVRRARFGTAYESGSDCEHRPGVLPPGGFGPSSPLHNLNEEPAGLPGAAPYPQRLALFRLLGVMALLDGAGCTRPAANSCCAPPEATDEEFRALVAKWRQERPSWRLKE